MTKQKNKILRYVGLTVLLIGITLNILMFLSYSWPSYFYFILCGIGVILIFLSFGLRRLSRLIQIAIAAVPFVIGFIYFEINSASDDIFLIPEDYRGQVLILYGQENGQPKEFENGWRIYRIPENGVLRTKFKLKGNYINNSSSKYFLVDKDGNRKLIKQYCEFCKDRDTTTVQVIFGSLGASSTGTTFQDFFVNVPNFEFKGLNDNRFDNIK